MVRQVEGARHRDIPQQQRLDVLGVGVVHGGGASCLDDVRGFRDGGFGEELKDDLLFVLAKRRDRLDEQRRVEDEEARGTAYSDRLVGADKSLNELGRHVYLKSGALKLRQKEQIEAAI